MLDRFNRFKQDGVFTALCEDVSEFEVYLLSPAEERRLQSIQKTLIDLNLITKQLQEPSFTFAQLRLLFDCVMQEYPTLNQYIASDSDIVHSVSFEAAIVKISSHQEHTLSTEEKNAVAKLNIPNEFNPVVSDNPGGELTIIQKAQARFRALYVFLFFLIIIYHNEILSNLLKGQCLSEYRLDSCWYCPCGEFLFNCGLCV
jgi:hypothetical protein